MRSGGEYDKRETFKKKKKPEKKSKRLRQKSKLGKVFMSHVGKPKRQNSFPGFQLPDRMRGMRGRKRGNFGFGIRLPPLLQNDFSDFSGVKSSFSISDFFPVPKRCNYFLRVVRTTSNALVTTVIGIVETQFHPPSDFAS